MKTREAKRLALAIELGFCALPQQHVLRKIALRLDRPLLLPGPDGSDLVYQPRSNVKKYAVRLGRGLSYLQRQPRLLSTFQTGEIKCQVWRSPEGAFSLDLLAGTDINRIAPAVKELSRALKASIRFNFNGVLMKVTPWYTGDIVAHYRANHGISDVPEANSGS